MYGISFTDSDHKIQPDVGKYIPYMDRVGTTIHSDTKNSCTSHLRYIKPCKEKGY